MRTDSSQKSIGRLLQRLAVHLGVALLGFAIGGLALYVQQKRSGPPLEIWHTTRLEHEFTVERASEITSFDGYLELEERLFAELDEVIYDQTPAGAGFELARFSAGSLADPRDHAPNWNRSFELAGDRDRPGVLLLHGMSDSPYSLRALGQSLHEAGCSILGLRLPGHGTIPSGIRTVTWEEMAAAVELAMESLASKVSPGAIYIIGYSTGAPLALNWVLDRMESDEDEDEGPLPAGLVLVSPSIGITRAARLARWLDAVSVVPGLQKLGWTSIRPEFDPYKYNSFTANAGYQVHRLTRSVAGRIEALGASAPLEGFPPTLVLLSSVDATVSVDAVIDNLLEHLAPPDHELVLFDVNRWGVQSSIMASDPGPLTARLLASDRLPFHLSLIANQSPESPSLVRRSKPPLSSTESVELLGVEWPRGLLSLSHVSLQFPPDDPLYGRRDLQPEGALPLGQIGVQGERGLLKFPTDYLLRVRHNPFYDLVEQRVLEWVGAGDRPPVESSEPAETR